MDGVKIVFIGCGDHSNRYIYPSLANVNNAELVAVCSLDPNEAEVNRKCHGAERAYTDYRKMIEAENPDAVIIVGPPRLHYEAGMYCLERKLPFYIEKPPGENLEQAMALAEASKKYATFGQVGFMMRHSAIVKKAQVIAEQENLGKLHYGTVKYFTSGPYRSDEIYGMPGIDDLSFLWRYLMVQAVHPVNLAASFLGEITEITPEVIFSGENILVDIKLRDGDGRRINALLHTFVAPGYGNLQFATELFFERRGMIVTDAFSELDYYPPAPPTGYLEGGNGNVIHWQFGTFGSNNVKMGYETEIAAFIDSVKTGVQPSTDLIDGLKTMHILTESFNQIENKVKKIMKQQILTFHDFANAMLQEQDFVLPEGFKQLQVAYSMISPGTELFCIREAIQSGSPVQPGYILTGSDETGQRCFLFPSLGESSACHCNIRAVGPDSLLLPLPPELKSEDAGFLRFINIGLHAFNQLNKLPETVCVIGLGPVGNLAAQTARLLGCRVVGVDPSASRRKIAEACGVSIVIAPEQLSGYNKSMDFVIDTVAASSTLKSSAAILRDGGECSMIGIIKDGELKASDIFREVWQRKLVFRSGWEMINPIKKQPGSPMVSTEENLCRALNWMVSGGYTLQPLLTGIIPAEIDAIKKAYGLLKDHPDDHLSFVIKWM